MPGSSQVSVDFLQWSSKRKFRNHIPINWPQFIKIESRTDNLVRNFPFLTRSLHNEYQESNVSNEDMETDDDDDDDGDAYDDGFDDSDSDE